MSEIEKHIERLRACGIDIIFKKGREDKVLDNEGKEDIPDSSIGEERELSELEREVKGCELCELHKTRNNTVFGEGDINAKIVFVGEAPGAEEDKLGRPFVGRAGKLLDKMLDAVKLNREDVYICNILKCRPPKNRDPSREEIESCTPYLEEQLRIISPDLIVGLGSFASRFLTGQSGSLSKMRQGEHSYRGIKVIPTYHTAYCLRNPDSKLYLMEDLQRAVKLIKGDDWFD